MRIIKIALILLALAAVIFPFAASADETKNTETNINLTTSFFSSLIAPAQASEGIVTAQAVSEKTPEVLAYEATLAKWKPKQLDKWNNLPKGEFTINVSAYTAAADECGNNKGITSSGVKVQAQRTIACPQEFPFGAKIKIADMGTFVCEDRGGAIKGNHIDIYMETKQEAFAFGRQNLIAQVVE